MIKFLEIHRIYWRLLLNKKQSSRQLCLLLPLQSWPPFRPLLSSAWKVTMYEEIEQTSEPDAKKQTFCHTGSRQTLFFLLLPAGVLPSSVSLRQWFLVMQMLYLRVVEVTAVEVLVILKRKLPLLSAAPLFGIAWKDTMVREIGPGSDPDAKRQTFFRLFSEWILPVADLKNT